MVLRLPQTPLRVGEQGRLTAEILWPGAARGKILHPPSLEAQWLQVQSVGVVSSGAIRQGRQVRIQQYLFDVLPLNSGQKRIPSLRATLQGVSGEVYLDAPEMSVTILPPLQRQPDLGERLRNHSTLLGGLGILALAAVALFFWRRGRSRRLQIEREAAAAASAPDIWDESLEQLSQVQGLVRKGNTREAMTLIASVMERALGQVISGSVSFSDPSSIVSRLADADVTQNLRRGIGSVVDACHRSRYAGITPREEEINSLCGEARRAIEALAARSRGPLYVCPTCGCHTSPEDTHCPQCGEVFE